MIRATIPTILLTDGHLLECAVEANGQRLLDLLNEQGTEFLHVTDVQVYRHASSQRIHAFADSVIRKSSITLAILIACEHEAPERRKNAFSAKTVYDAFATVADYEVSGKLHLKGRPDTASFLTQEANSFVPFAKANVNFHGCPDAMQERVVIVRKSAINLLQITEQAETENDVLASIRELIKETAPAGESLVGDRQAACP